MLRYSLVLTLTSPRHGVKERMSEEREGKVVCVTGASGYIASCLVNLLLQRGYTVKATVRDPNDPKTEFLRALDGAKERLQLFKANLLEDGSFDSAVDGCVGVFHTASPVIFSTNDPQAELIDPAVKGTLNILRSCAKFHSVKRVVVTSSIATLLYAGTPVSSDVVVDETWFSKPEVCKAANNFYALAKTLAEDAAWRFAKENGIDLVTIHPGIVIGTSLQPNLNLSVEVILHLVNGVRKFPGPHGYVDVRDVAHAHIQAFEVPTANGRYALIERVAQRYELLKSLRDQFPTLQLAEKLEDETCKPEPSFQFSKERAQSLGINFTPLEISLRDTIESLKEKGFLNF